MTVTTGLMTAVNHEDTKNTEDARRPFWELLQA